MFVAPFSLLIIPVLQEVGFRTPKKVGINRDYVRVRDYSQKAICQDRHDRR